VQWVATVHGGSVTVASALGHGSTFTVTLPASGRAERTRAIT
jgi:signal transduction histidine kinase